MYIVRGYKIHYYYLYILCFNFYIVYLVSMKETIYYNPCVHFLTNSARIII